MSLAKVYSRANLGIDAPLVTVEVHLANGLPCFHLVGLAETSVREARERVRSALINAGFEFPAKRITVNLAPADLPKEGGRFDLAIALGILGASGLIPIQAFEHIEAVGELALCADLRPTQAVLPVAIQCASSHRALLLPASNAAEAALLQDLNVIPLVSLEQAYLHLSNKQPVAVQPPSLSEPQTSSQHQDLRDIRGQQAAKRALRIAAAGQHNLLMVGPPGSGKTMLASRFRSLLPPLDEQQALEVARIRSVCGLPFDPDSWRLRPFRQPHHTSSAVALCGGGSVPKPGEISLAHCGILFLDELPEFERRVLDALREPMESGEVHISRAAHQARFPASFQLIAAMNPSPTGDWLDGRSSTEQITRYLNRLSGPFLDRFDLQVDVPRISVETLAQSEPRAEPGSEAKKQVSAARERQLRRQGYLNHRLTGEALEQHCALQRATRRFLLDTMQRLNLSMRAFHRVLRVSRTIADLQDSQWVKQEHVAEALSYRALENIINHLRRC